VAQYTQVTTAERDNHMPDSNISLKEAFDIHHREVISLVGGGGKTTLMAALAKELTAGGAGVITTATTKIFEWQAPGSRLIIEADKNRLFELAVQTLQKHRHITLASGRLPADEKLDGISPQMIGKLADLEQVDYIIVEADGAARKPLKAPNATEPVIPGNTSLVIAVVGIDALDKKLDRENVFRPEIVSRLTGLASGKVVTADAIAALIVHREGIAKGSPTAAAIIPLINKVDTEEDKAKAEDLAQKILETGQSHIKRVVLGQLQSTQPVVGVINLP